MTRMKPLYRWLIGGAFLLLVVTKRQEVLNAALSAEQNHFISELHPKAQPTLAQFIARVQQELGYNVIVTSGNRSFAEQVVLHLENPSNAVAGSSYHNFGMALDINLQRGFTYVRKADTKETWLATGVPQLAKSMGLYWGGDFTGYYDPVHFEYRIKDINTLKSLAVAQFGNDPRLVQGNKLIV